MDGFLAIEHNVEALRRVLAALLAMAGLRGQFAFFPQTGALPQDLAQGEKSKLSPAATLPRHLYRAILRILRPAEAAARRLIIALARGLLVPPSRPGGKQSLRHAARAPKTLSLSILDPLSKNPFREERVAGALPRICVPGVTARRPVPLRLPCRPGDAVDATRIGLRLAALGRALADLPGHAKRFARWRGRRRRGPFHRVWPLRMGRPPGTCRRSNDEVQDILSHANELALYALEKPDTS